MIADSGQRVGTQAADFESGWRSPELPEHAGQSRLPLPPPTSEGLASLIEAALLHWDSDRAAAKRLVAEASAFLRQAPTIVAASPTRAAPIPNVGLVRWKAIKALAYMEANLGSKLDIGKLADVLALSKSHFSRAFKCSLGVSPMAFLHSKRIAKARELMTTTDKRLSEIAAVCGFSDQSHLNRCFKRSVGLSPGRWRSICLEMRATGSSRH